MVYCFASAELHTEGEQANGGKGGILSRMEAGKIEDEKIGGRQGWRVITPVSLPGTERRSGSFSVL